MWHNDEVDTQTLLESFGYLVIFASVFIESGVILGLVLPLPGFSLLFTAGVFAATGGQFNPIAIIAIGGLGAILGYVVGYYTGATYGRKLFYQKDTTRYFTREQGEKTEKFMKKYGYSTLIIGRYLPVIHTLAPILSGIAKTPKLPFMVANIAGGLIWAISATLLGYYLGQTLPKAQYLVIPLIIISLLLVHSPIGKRVVARITAKIEE